MCVSVSVASSFHHIISLGTACGDSVFCGLGTASGDSCQFFSFRLLMSLGTACVDSVFCSVTYFCESSGAASGDPFVPFAFIASFLWAPPVATQFSVLRAPPVATLLSFPATASYLWAPPVATQFSFLSCSVLCVRAQPVTTREPELRPGRQNYDQGGRITAREAELRPGRQNYDQGGLVLSGSPQAELRPGRQNYNLGAHPQAGLRPMSSSS